MSLLKALSFPRFTLLWIGQALSRAGDAMYRVALAWWVLEQTGSATEMGLLFIFSFAPMILFLLIGGVAVDRFPRGKVMLLSDLIRGVVIAIVSLLAFTNLLEVWHLYIASISHGIVSAFFHPSYTALVPEIVPDEALSSANSLTNLSKQASDIAGPALGATLIMAGGPALVFAANSGSFFASGICLLPLLGLPPALQSRPTSAGIWYSIREGIETVLRRQWLWLTIAIAAFSNITLAGPLSVALPFLIKDHLRADVRALGIVYSMIALGSVLGSVWVGRQERIRHRGLIAYGAWIVIGLMTLLFGLSPSVFGVWAAACICGIGVSVFSLIWVRTLQELVPRELLGRVASIDNLGSAALLPVGYGVIGWATDQMGASMVFIAGGVFTMLLAALGLTQSAVRKLD